MPIFTPDQIQMALDDATERGYAHFNKLDWLPEWTSSKPVLQDNMNQPPQCSPKPLRCVNLPNFKERIDKLKKTYSTPDQLKHVSTDREVEDPNNPETGAKLTKAPNPGADFSHVDSGVFTEPQRKQFHDAIKALKDVETLSGKDGELRRAIREALQPLRRAEGLLDIDPKGMQRLKLIFEWTLCHVTTLYGEINAALENSDLQKGKDEYNAARARYITLLEDLDDHEPETRGVPKSGECGYGRAIKWSYILPLIHGGKIKGAKVVTKWNPHISSSGVPIPHK